jgi:hypothetical protein
MTLNEAIDLFLQSHTPSENQPQQTLHQFRTWYWSTILNYNLPIEETTDIDISVSYTEETVNKDSDIA